MTNLSLDASTDAIGANFCDGGCSSLQVIVFDVTAAIPAGAISGTGFCSATTGTVCDAGLKIYNSDATDTATCLALFSPA